MARSRGCGRGKLVATSSLESCWTCCPPVLHFRAAGEGDRAACLSSLFPSHLSSGQKLLRRSAERSAPKPELVRGPGLWGSRGLELWNLGPEEPRTQGYWFVQREGDQETRLSDPWVRRQGHGSLTQLGQN